MQEEVETRTVNFVVTTSKLSAQVLISGIRRVLQSQSYRRAQKKSEKRQIRTRVKAAENADCFRIIAGTVVDFCNSAPCFAQISGIIDLGHSQHLPFLLCLW